MADPTEHAILAPSAAESWINCVGSPFMQKGLPDVESEYAKEGTAAHEYAAIWLETNIPPFLPWKAKNGFKFSNTGDEDAMDSIRHYVDTIKDLAKGRILLVEQRLPIEQITHEPTAAGTSDAIIIEEAEETLSVNDLKFGMGVRVYAKKNKQMMIYALGAKYQFAAFGKFRKFILRIHQPRLDHLDEWECSLEELEAFALEAEQSARLAWAIYKGEIKLNPKEHLKPSEKACRWCKARATCPAAINNALTIAAGSFTDLTKNPASKLEEALQRVDHLDSQQLSWLMQNAGVLEAIVKAVRAKVEGELLAGRQIPGFKLVAGKKGNRKWEDETLVEEVLKNWRLPADDMYKMKIISPSDADKFFKNQPKRWAKLKSMITQSDGAPSVTPTTDPRPALENKPLEDSFEVIE